MDRISQLPDFIVHHILSLFDTSHAPIELIRMSVLSKTWFDLTSSFPVLDFRIDKFTKNSHVSRQSFFKYVDYTTSRFCHQNVTAHKLKLITTLQEPAELDTVNRCLDLVLKNGVRELVFNFTGSYDVQKYRLPNILLSVSVLTSLKICGCELPSSLMVDAVKFKSLIYLSLHNVAIDDEVIKYLTTSCPLLQVLKIRFCHGFKRFCVYGHQNLQDIWVGYNTRVQRIERIDIEALNLSNLFVADRSGRGAPQMSLASCQKLTTVTYVGHPVPNFLSNLPFIENLVLAKYKCKNLKLSSHSLRTLLLHSNCDLEEIEFSTPNLVLFIYACRPSLLWPLMMEKRWTMARQSSHLKACMQCYPASYIDTLWFQKLRLFLDKKNGFKVLNLYIHTSRNVIELEKLKAIELPPYELEHVELQLDTHDESPDHVAFVDAVLWCCRPRSLTLRSSFPFIDFEKQSDVVNFTYEKLLEQEDQGHTSIQIVLPSSSESQKHLRELKSLSMGLPLEGKTISFIKEEVVEKEVG